MVVNNPATPSNATEATTDDQSLGGLFSDSNAVGLDLSGLVGPQGPEGPQGDPGVGITGVSESQNGENVTLTFSLSDNTSDMITFQALQGPEGDRGDRGFSITRVEADPQPTMGTNGQTVLTLSLIHI